MMWRNDKLACPSVVRNGWNDHVTGQVGRNDFPVLTGAFVSRLIRGIGALIRRIVGRMTTARIGRCLARHDWSQGRKRAATERLPEERRYYQQQRKSLASHDYCPCGRVRTHLIELP